MITEVRVVQYGRPAGEALAAVVAAAKGGHPLAPVTVVVSSNFAGLSARRLLASGAIGGRGVANVQWVTPFRLAELLSANLLHDRRPITNPVLAAAVRRALAEDPGPFAEVARHHATETALAGLYGELSHVSEATLTALEQAGGSAAIAARAFRGVAAQLGAFQGEDDVARAAAGRADLQTALESFGHLVWYLPEPVTPALGGLLRSVLQAAPASVIVGVTGAADADAAVVAACARAGVEVPAGEVAAIEAPVGSHIVSVTDADEEVRAVVRRIAGLLEDGVPLDRIGVFHPVPDPYVHTLQQQLADAGIPANGPSRERLLDSVAGRTLLAALALPGERWRRDRVMALVSGGPVRHGEQRTFPTSWERLSRKAGVVQDLADWRRKLAGFAAAIDERIGSVDAEEHAGAMSYLERERDDAGALAAFVDDLAGGVAAVDDARGWTAKAGAARRLLHHLLGPEQQRQSWPEREQIAATRVEDALTRLATLDEIEPDPPADVLRRALISELDVTRGRVGRFGDGVVYGPLHTAAGHDLDAVFILGLTEGQCPAPRRDDALLPDAARALAAPDFTEWDGNLAGTPVPSPASGQLLSASRLETWAACGYRYFLASVLDLGGRDDPERIIELSALDRGVGLHGILEKFFGEVIDAGPPDPATPWTSAQRERLQAIAGAVFDELERTGRTGRPLHWRLERQRLAVVLDEFLTEDDRHRAATGSTPHRVEFPFGMKGAEPVVVELPGGRAIRLRGQADRVDVTADGRHLVSDYKTGKGKDYDKIAEGDPTREGTVLQLGLYSEAALGLLGAAAAEAHYWMVNEDAGYARRGYRWDEPRRARFVEVLGGIVDGIEQGVFPAVPGEWDGWRNTHENCRYCDFDDVCPRARGEFADTKADAPQLRVRDILRPAEEES